MKRIIASLFIFAALAVTAPPRDIPPGDPCWPASSDDYQNHDGSWTCASE